MGECREVPLEAVDGYQNLSEMYLGVGVERNAGGASIGPDENVPSEGIDVSLAYERDATACLADILRTNPSLASQGSQALDIIRHFRNTDQMDPNHVTWEELTRDYGASASMVARSLSAYSGLLTFVTSPGPLPSDPTGTARGDTATSASFDLRSYADVIQASIGLGVERDDVSGVFRSPLPSIPEEGIDLNAAMNPNAAARLAEVAADNSELLGDIQRVQQILQGLRQANSTRPGVVTLGDIQRLYGESSGGVIVSINAYLGLLRLMQGSSGDAAESDPSSPGGDDAPWINSWLVGGIAAGVAFTAAGLIGMARARLAAAVPPAAEAIRLPIASLSRGDQRFVLGRGETGGSYISIPNRADDLERNFVSTRHAELRWSPATRQLFIQDLGSSNGTEIFREDANGAVCEGIPVSPGGEVLLREGDVIRFGRSYYAVSLPRTGPTLRRTVREGVSPQEGMEGLPAQFVSERPLIERLREAQRAGRPIEFFTNRMEKLAGQITEMRVGLHGVVHIQGEDGRLSRISLSDIVTIRGRGQTDDLTLRYSRVPNPQLRDKSYNDMALGNRAYQVLVDYADPRLSNWLERGEIGRIRDAYEHGQISQRQAAEAVWQTVRSQIPYDESRYHNGERPSQLPDQLFRLGDFIETGVCNERGMLVQVALQYIGIESRFVIGDWGGRHAWVRATVDDRRGGVQDLLIDPQRRRVLQVGTDSEVSSYVEETERPVHNGMVTVDADSLLRGVDGSSAERAAPTYDRETLRDQVRAVLPEWLRNDERLIDQIMMEAGVTQTERLAPFGALRDAAYSEVRESFSEGRLELAQRHFSELSRREAREPNYLAREFERLRQQRRLSELVQSLHPLATNHRQYFRELVRLEGAVRMALERVGRADRSERRWEILREAIVEETIRAGVGTRDHMAPRLDGRTDLLRELADSLRRDVRLAERR